MTAAFIGERLFAPGSLGAKATAELSTGDAKADAALKTIEEGKLPDAEQAAETYVKEGAGVAAAGACAAVGAAALAPLCHQIGGELTAIVIEEVWPSVKEFFSDAGNAVADLFGFGNDAEEEAARRRRRNAISALALKFEDHITKDVRTAETGLTTTVTGIILLSRKLKLKDDLSKFGWEQVTKRLVDVYGLNMRTIRDVPESNLYTNARLKEEAGNRTLKTALWVPDFWPPSSAQKIADRLPAKDRKYCSRAGYTAEQWDKDVGPTKGMPHEESRTLWKFCGWPHELSETTVAAKQAAAKDIDDAIIGWLAKLRRAYLKEAALLAKLATNKRAAEVAERATARRPPKLPTAPVTAPTPPAGGKPRPPTPPTKTTAPTPTKTTAPARPKPPMPTAPPKPAPAPSSAPYWPYPPGMLSAPPRGGGGPPRGAPRPPGPPPPGPPPGPRPLPGRRAHPHGRPWPGWWSSTWAVPWIPPEIIKTTTIETCRTWGDPIEMPYNMQIAAKTALGASGGRPTTVRGPDGVLYLFAFENGALTARPCAAIG